MNTYKEYKEFFHLLWTNNSYYLKYYDTPEHLFNTLISFIDFETDNKIELLAQLKIYTNTDIRFIDGAIHWLIKYKLGVPLKDIELYINKQKQNELLDSMADWIHRYKE
jgi:hypothetical protein